MDWFYVILRALFELPTEFVKFHGTSKPASVDPASHTKARALSQDLTM